jgi:uncharacterized ferredoxin-like protein
MFQPIYIDFPSLGRPNDEMSETERLKWFIRDASVIPDKKVRQALRIIGLKWGIKFRYNCGSCHRCDLDDE